MAHKLTSAKNQPQFSKMTMGQYWLSFQNKLPQNLKKIIQQNLY